MKLGFLFLLTETNRKNSRLSRFSFLQIKIIWNLNFLNENYNFT